MDYKVCVITLALPIEIDPRSFRQIEYLSSSYRIAVIGFGQIPTSWSNIDWKPINRSQTPLRHALEVVLLFLGRLSPRFYDLYFWSRSRYRQALEAAVKSDAHIYHASDWAAVPIAVRAAQQNGAQVVFDADEHWPTERESSWAWKNFFAPMIHHFLKRFAGGVSITTHVSDPILQRYKAEYGLDGVIIYNAPDFVETPDHAINPEAISLIYHGAAISNRKLEVLINAIARSEPRFQLHFLLVGDQAYIARLQNYAQQHAPGRVYFEPPVSIHDVVQTISLFDIEISFTAPTTFTNRYTLPNKIFEAAVAGLGVIVGPDTAHEQLVQQYGYGIATRSFEALDLADTLNSLTIAQIAALRKAAREAGHILNSRVEREKFLGVYAQILKETTISRNQTPS